MTGTGSIIDLLSSEDEARVRRSSPQKSKVKAVASRTDDSLCLLSEFNSIEAIDGDWGGGPSKRRKLSPSTVTENDRSTSPQLPCKVMKATSCGFTTGEATGNEPRWTMLSDEDPIDFTTSIRQAVPHVHKETNTISPVCNDLSEDDLPDDILSAPVRGKPAGLSVRTAAVLDGLSKPTSRVRPAAIHKRSTDVDTGSAEQIRQGLAASGNVSDSEDGERAREITSKARKKSKITQEEKDATAREKASKTREKEHAKKASKEQKAKEKEEDRERKRLLKEEKVREKRIAADLTEVNKSKLDKKDSTPEMIVDLPASIDGQSVDTQIRQFLKNLEVDATLYQSTLPNVIKWRRKLKARWNAELDYWEPIDQMEIHDEKHVMCLMSAKEFVGLATNQNDDQDLDTHVTKLRSAHSGCIPIYLIEGLHGWMKRNKNAENRAYQARVNLIDQANESSSTSQHSRSKKPAPEIVNDDLIEDALLRLQVIHGCLVHLTSTSAETAEWVATFTQHISTIPYRYISPHLPTSI